MNRSWRALALALVTLLLTPTTTASAPPVLYPYARATCAGGVDAARLNRRFAAGVGSMVGADYQRAFPLPDGRRL
jgi:hypothetical protein